MKKTYTIDNITDTLIGISKTKPLLIIEAWNKIYGRKTDNGISLGIYTNNGETVNNIFRYCSPHGIASRIVRYNEKDRYIYLNEQGCVSTFSELRFDATDDGIVFCPIVYRDMAAHYFETMNAEQFNILYDTSMTDYFCDEVDDAEEKIKQMLPKTELPKLTVEVFDRPDCPKWAKYAAVDKDGGLYFYANEPSLETSAGEWSYYYGDGRWGRFGDNFDASDWKNSLIERPAKLPDWCKVGGVVFDCNEREYARVLDIMNDDDVVLDYMETEPSIQIKSKKYIIDCCFQARIRPYNVNEMRALVGKIINDNVVYSLVLECCQLDGECKVRLMSGYYSPDEILSRFTRNGLPCGVPEHLVDDEWVED